eukprot:1160027-Pelagomonas_calceolata.AAC.8
MSRETKRLPTANSLWCASQHCSMKVSTTHWREVSRLMNTGVHLNSVSRRKVSSLPKVSNSLPSGVGHPLPAGQRHQGHVPLVAKESDCAVAIAAAYAQTNRNILGSMLQVLTPYNKEQVWLMPVATSRVAQQGKGLLCWDGLG